MEYSWTELIIFMLFYGFIGWAIEVVVSVVMNHKFSNRGFFNLPICPKYGIMVDILLIILPYVGEEFSPGNFLSQAVITLVVVSVVEFLTGDAARRIWGRRLWHYERYTLFGGELKGGVLSFLEAVTVFLIIKLLHPFVFFVVALIPVLILRVAAAVLLLLLAADLVTVIVAIRKSHNEEEFRQAEKGIEDRQFAAQGKLGSRMFRSIWKRLDRAYPGMDKLPAKDSGKDYYVFAQGICMDKLLWVFIICALIGDLFETVYCRFTAGYWMSRTSVIYGTFSIVWGMGGVVLTLVLRRLAERPDRYVFLAGAFLGGVYEYTCSVVSEVIFGTTFWDYSDIPLNIGGRTNVWYCIFWGLASVFWIKVCYPRISRLIEKLHPLYAKVFTWIVAILMAADLALSGAVLLRYVNRLNGEEPGNILEEFIDDTYSDEFIEDTWPNMVVTD